MNSSLNLASRPFSNRVLPWALTAIVLFVAVIGLIIVVRLTTVANRQAAAIQVENNALKQQERALMESATAIKQEMSQEQQKAVPAAHKLIDRKLFSWSRLLADFEAALPSNVRVSRIAVRDVATQADSRIATLDLAVFAQDPATISDMIAKMHKEGIFQLVLRSQNLAKGRGEKGTEYEFDVIYRAPAGYAAESVAGVNPTQNPGESSR